MNLLKNYWAKLLGLFQWMGILNKMRTLTESFPGVENEDKLRLWVIQQADNFQPVVEKTANKIDDVFLHKVQCVALNWRAFHAIYNLVLLGCEVIPKGGTVS